MLSRLSGAEIVFTAFHTNPMGNEGRHEHTWRVTAWKCADPWFDLTTLREALRAVLDSLRDGDDLKPRFWSNEAIADVVMTLEGVRRVTIDRDGFRVDFS